MFIVIGIFALVVFMLLIGFVGELLFSSKSSGDELKEDSEELEELSTQNILDQLK